MPTDLTERKKVHSPPLWLRLLFIFSFMAAVFSFPLSYWVGSWVTVPAMVVFFLTTNYIALYPKHGGDLRPMLAKARTSALRAWIWASNPVAWLRALHMLVFYAVPCTIRTLPSIACGPLSFFGKWGEHIAFRKLDKYWERETKHHLPAYIALQKRHGLAPES